MMNTFIIVNITPTCKRQFRGQEQNVLGHSFEKKADCFVLKAIRVLPISTQAEQTEDGEHFVNG